MHDTYAAVAHWDKDFDESGLEAWARETRVRLKADAVTLGTVFMTPAFFPHAETILEICRVHARVPLLVGCSSTSLVAADREHEEVRGLVLGLHALPGAELKAFHFSRGQWQSSSQEPQSADGIGVGREDSNGWLVFADPARMDIEHWLDTWNSTYPGVPILGGLASAYPQDRRTQVYLDGNVYEEGAVALSVGGEVRLAGVVSQGCSPIGEAWTVTRVDQNLIHRIGNRPAYEILAETFHGLSPDEQKEAQGNLFVGLVVDEYLEEFHRGDFLIRNLLGADPRSGSIAVGALARLGQSIQFQRRDAAAASDDLKSLLRNAQAELRGTRVYSGCLCCCNGRGRHLFGKPHHDASLIQEFLGPIGLTGFFCNGEIGPIGGHNYLHGYTASLALFVGK